MKRKWLFFIVLFTFVLLYSTSALCGMEDYTASPTFVTQDVPPNILIVMDNSGSMNEFAYKAEGTSKDDDNPDTSFDSSETYYGYFDPSKNYEYESEVFVETNSTSETWSGNFLNWLTMRRIDLMRKVVMGGKQVSRQDNTNRLEGEPEPDRNFYKEYNCDKSRTPYSGSDTLFNVGGSGVTGGYFEVNGDTYKIVVEPSGDATGVLQNFVDSARFGLMFFNDGNKFEASGDDDGGYLNDDIDGPGGQSNLLTALQNTGCSTWTPLAESLYAATRYFQVDDNPYTGDPNNHDPIQHWCQKNFVLYLTDGASTKDQNIPGGHWGSTVSDSSFDVKTYMDAIAIEENATSKYSSSLDDEGTYYMGGVSYYAHTTDLRPADDDFQARQNLNIYTVFAFDESQKARELLQMAAKYGGFEDKNNNDKPDQKTEWARPNSTIPKTYYEAQEGPALETKLTSAINDILERASSGTAVSVLATSQEGEGNIVQAYFRPQVTKGARTLNWLGYLHSLWVDSRGNLREDSNNNDVLELDKDNVVRTFTDNSTAETKAKVYEVSPSNKYPAENESYDVVALQELNSIWKAGERLAETSASDRVIFTFLDKNNNDATDSEEVVDFKDSIDEIDPYLGVADDSLWSHLGDTKTKRADNIINFVRGNEIDGLRTRNTGNSTIWKLGDIVHSTPMVVSEPVENYNTLYGDDTYDEYVKKYKNRETVVYVGANDGLFHAFTSGKYDKDNKEYKPVDSTPLGEELWAYAPQNLLPHLKWLPNQDYEHVYYVDQKPRIFDARILDNNTHYTSDNDNEDWGTFVLCGMRLGGKHIQSEDDFDGDGNKEVRDFHSAYFLLDVTDPRNPEVMWERSYEGLNLTTSRPAIMRVNGKWYAIFGSGPETYEGTAPNVDSGKVYVVDLKTGQPVGSDPWRFETADRNAFMGSPVTFDRARNYHVDAAYIGETHDVDDGKLYKVTVPVTDGTSYALDPNNYKDPADWKMHALFDSDPGSPITAAPSISIDEKNNVWIYGGTGRYFRQSDETTDNTQYMFGIKDPFYNRSRSTYYHNYSNSITLDTGHLYDVSGIKVTTDGVVYDSDDTLFDDHGEWGSLLSAVESKDGWYFELDDSRERIIEKPVVLGGIVLTPSFIPNEDVCGYGGDSNLYAVYYTTGTAYTESVIGTKETNIDSNSVKVNRKKFSLGTGKASSVGMHVGAEEGGTAFIQESTGNIREIDVDPAMDVKSGILYWKVE